MNRLLQLYWLSWRRMLPRWHIGLPVSEKWSENWPAKQGRDQAWRPAAREPFPRKQMTC